MTTAKERIKDAIALQRYTEAYRESLRKDRQRLVEALRDVLMFTSTSGEGAYAVDSARALLRELGEEQT